MVEEVNTVACRTFTKERQPEAVSELSYHQPNQPPQNDHAPSYPQPTQGQAWGTACRKQAGFRPGRGIAEQIFYSRIITEKHLQHERDLFHNFTGFKMTVWHAGLWQVLRSFNIDEGLVQAIEALYENSSSAVLLNCELGEFFKTPVGVCW